MSPAIIDQAVNKLNGSKRSLCSLLFVLWLGFFGFAFKADEGRVTPPYAQVPPQEGERCAVCGVPLTSEDVVLIVRGRRVPLNKEMVGEFLSRQEEYFRSRQPKGALFQEEFQTPPGVSQSGISLRWFLVGLYIVTALVFAGLSGYVAVAKGLPPIPYFFLALAFNVFGFLYVLTRPSESTAGAVPPGLVKIPVTHEPLACGACGNTNHPAAARCASCGVSLTPRISSEVSRAV
ncbi:MAG: hypothetical protein AB1898_08190 [Acidobacteriota bacterium]